MSVLIARLQVSLFVVNYRYLKDRLLVERTGETDECAHSQITGESFGGELQILYRQHTC